MKEPPNTLLDHAGYPTEEYLAWIDSFRPENNLDDYDPLEFLAVIERGWWMSDWGFHLKRKYKGYVRLYLSTGGWSGNEEIMAHLQQTWFYFCYWRSHRAGGHYEFLIPVRE